MKQSEFIVNVNNNVAALAGVLIDVSSANGGDDNATIDDKLSAALLDVDVAVAALSLAVGN
ncbi:MAG: hypothetical protein CTY21_11700 [Methylomonas sp.]|nr:MAG: hypothetical protein CTY21_11700 [Methylomonas sp.]